jgi:hypothetical protein
MLMRSRQHDYEEALSAVSGAVTRALDRAGDPTGGCLPTRIETDPSPIRFTVNWQPFPNGEHRARFGQASATTVLRSATAEAAVESHEIVARLRVPLSSWVDARGRVRLLDDIASFTDAFRLTEQRTVLKLLCAGRPAPEQVRSVAAVQRAVARLNGAPATGEAGPDHLFCRLLASGPTLSAALSRGIVQDAVDVRGALPVGVGAIVVPTVGGPVVERIVDDITLLSGVAGDAMWFTLVQRFFLTNPDRVELLAPYGF